MYFNITAFIIEVAKANPAPIEIGIIINSESFKYELYNSLTAIYVNGIVIIEISNINEKQYLKTIVKIPSLDLPSFFIHDNSTLCKGLEINETILDIVVVA